MRYLVISCERPLTFLSCGQLVKEKNFLHPKRCIDSYVLIYVLEGTLHISQHGVNYDIGTDQFIILFAETEHFGYRKSSEYLHYCWVHFYIPDPFTCISLEQYPTDTPEILPGKYAIPEIGILGHEKRIPILFSQLLDMSIRYHQAFSYQLHYSLTALMLELANECFFHLQAPENEHLRIYRIQNWIRTNYQRSITVSEIAELFHYNPDYLSGKFKKITGISPIRYINFVRIEAARKYLITTDLSLKEIAVRCGFSDEKYFYKVFKQFEGMTPTEFRGAFFKKKEVNK